MSENEFTHLFDVDCKINVRVKINSDLVDPENIRLEFFNPKSKIFYII